LKNKITGRNIASLPFVCLRNRQADLPRMNGEYPKKRGFLLKRCKVIAFFFLTDASPQKMPPEDFTP
jgi:hypothetical protein